MGYAKYAEDIQKIRDENEYIHTIVVPNAPPEIYYDCYYCDKSFVSAEGRNAHIKKEHNVVGPLLFVNGKMCSGTEYVEKIDSVKIVSCGFSDIVIRLNDEGISNDDVMDITDKAKGATVHPIIIRIGRSEYTLHLFKKTNISNADIERVIESWESCLESNLPIKKQYLKNFNSAEIRYLDGFFNYFTACKAESADKKKRYEDAFSILSEFSSLTPKARVLLKVIAFRLNWIERLEVLCKTSSGAFNSVLAFFKNRQTEKSKLDEWGKDVMIFVESEAVNCLEAIMAFQEEDWASVDKYIDSLDDTEVFLMKDTNFKDRVLLLKARRMKMRGEYTLAQKYYAEIKTPCFRAEAETSARV